jgi:hypothetical protein
MGKKNKVGTFAHAYKLNQKNEFFPDWAEARLSVTAHGDGVFSVASAEFYLTANDLRILINTAQESLDKIMLAKLEEEN